MDVRNLTDDDVEKLKVEVEKLKVHNPKINYKIYKQNPFVVSIYKMLKRPVKK